MHSGWYQMHPTKTPGPDGMPPLFFQKYWDIVGPCVLDCVLQALNSGTMPPHANETYILGSTNSQFEGPHPRWTPLLCIGAVSGRVCHVFLFFLFSTTLVDVAETRTELSCIGQNRQFRLKQVVLTGDRNGPKCSKQAKIEAIGRRGVASGERRGIDCVGEGVT